MLFQLGWKNIWRNKKRSLIMLLAIAFGLWAGLFSAGFFSGMIESMVNMAIDRNLAHVQFHSPGYTKVNKINNYIENAEKIIGDIKKKEHVESITARTLVEGMASSASSNFGVNIIGVVPENEADVTIIDDNIIEGMYFEGIKRNPCLIGDKLADRLNLKVKSKLILSFQGLDSSLIYASFRVSGIYNTESQTFDQSYVIVNREDLYRILDTEPIIHEIAVRVTDNQYTEKMTNILKSEYESLDIESWREISPELRFYSEATSTWNYLFVAIILFALLFGIINTMLMSVMDRIREFGMLLAIGMKRKKVFMLITIETVYLSLTGAVAGIILGAVTIAIFSSTGIDISAFGAGTEWVGVSSVVYPELAADAYVVITIMVTVAAIIASVFPALKAIRLKPAEAIRVY